MRSALRTPSIDYAPRGAIPGVAARQAEGAFDANHPSIGRFPDISLPTLVLAQLMLCPA